MKETSCRRWRWVIVILSMVVMMHAAFFTVLGHVEAAGTAKKQSKTKTVTVWLQVTDSCKQALSGATFKVTGPEMSAITSPTNGTTPRSLSSSTCPLQQGTCVNFSTGCTSLMLHVPHSGTSISTITVWQTAPGKKQTGNAAYGANWTYAMCEGGSACSKPEVATVRVTSSGKVTAIVLNRYPDGTSVTWPSTKGAYSGVQSDPILFHEFGISQTSGAANQCDGDHDADDYLTGTPGQHCDSDQD